nr:MAG TPA: NUDIX hydrolase [Caudoviricetes sp.]
MKHQQPFIGAYLLLIKNNQLLLEKRLGGILNGKYTPIAGHTESGETVIDAIIREAKEEADINLKADDLEVKVIIQRPSAQYKGTPTDIIDFFIFAENYSGEISNKEPEKCSEIAFYPLNNLPKDTLPHVKKAVQAYFDGQCFLVC